MHRKREIEMIIHRHIRDNSKFIIKENDKGSYDLILRNIEHIEVV